jgi:hypothetical protein
VSNNYCKDDKEGDTILLVDDRDNFQKLQFGGDASVGPTGHKEWRRNRIHALASNVGRL